MATLSNERIQKVAMLARMAPSGANMQPWKMVWDGEFLSIYHVPKKGYEILSPDYWGDIMSFGFLKEALILSASLEGLSILFEPVDFSADDRLWIRASFQETNNAPKPFADTLLTRWTERKKFKKGNINDPVFRACLEDQEHSSNVKLHLTPPNASLIRQMVKFDNYLWTHKPLHQAFFEWFRLTKSEEQKKQDDGMDRSMLGVNAFELLLLRVCRNFLFQRLLNPIFVSVSSLKMLVRILSSTTLGLITFKAVTGDQIMEATQYAMRTWLRLNQQGYPYQPMSALPLAIFFSYSDVRKTLYPKHYWNDVPKAEKVLRKNFNLADDEIPLWLFRTGKAVSIPTKHTPRIKLEDFYEEKILPLKTIA